MVGCHILYIFRYVEIVVTDGISKLVFLVTLLTDNKTLVIRLSNPVVYLSVSLYFPSTEMILPDGKVYNRPSQIEAVMFTTPDIFTVRFIVLIRLSQPLRYLTVSL